MTIFSFIKVDIEIVMINTHFEHEMATSESQRNLIVDHEIMTNIMIFRHLTQ